MGDNSDDSCSKWSFVELKSSKRDKIKPVNELIRKERFHSCSDVLKQIEFASHNLSSSSKHEHCNQRSVRWLLICASDL